MHLYSTFLSENDFTQYVLLVTVGLIGEKQGVASIYAPTHVRTAEIWKYFCYYSLITFVKVPVSTYTAEHSLSSMNRLKTPFRSTETDGRLSSLAIFHLLVHKHKDVDIDDVIT